MNRPVVPVRDVAFRMPSQGRIRMGEKGTRGNPVALDKFRLTSSDQAAIAEIANRYGGSPRPWAGGPRSGEWEVKIEATELPIALPPDPLGGTPCYELWSGGGCQRRCDGETCAVPSTEGMQDVNCLCSGKGMLECKPIVRLSVILREIRFGGTWMLEAHGFNAFQEMPGMVEMIASLQQRGITRAALSLEPRMKKVGGQTKKFVVPVLRLADSAEALMAGRSSMTALATTEAPRGLPAARLADEDDEDDPIIDAEVVPLPVWPGPTESELIHMGNRIKVQARLTKPGDSTGPVDGQWFSDKLKLDASKGEWNNEVPVEQIKEEWWRNLLALVDGLETGLYLAQPVEDGKLKLTK